MLQVKRFLASSLKDLQTEDSSHPQNIVQIKSQQLLHSRFPRIQHIQVIIFHEVESKLRLTDYKILPYDRYTIVIQYQQTP